MRIDFSFNFEFNFKVMCVCLFNYNNKSTKSCMTEFEHDWIHLVYLFINMACIVCHHYTHHTKCVQHNENGLVQQRLWRILQYYLYFHIFINSISYLLSVRLFGFLNRVAWEFIKLVLHLAYSFFSQDEKWFIPIEFDFKANI